MQNITLINKQGLELFFFLPFRLFFLIRFFCTFSLLFAACWIWKLPFQLPCNISELNTSDFPWNWQHFGNCHSLELEAAVVNVFATFLSSNCSCSMVVCNQGWFRVFACFQFLRFGFKVRLYLSSVKGQLKLFLGFGLSFIQTWLKTYYGWFRTYLGLVQGLLRVGYGSMWAWFEKYFIQGSFTVFLGLGEHLIGSGLG